MKSKATIILALMLLLSVGLNIRLMVVFSDSHDDYWVSMSEFLAIEGKALDSLGRGDSDTAEKILSQDIQWRVMALAICIEEKCVRDDAAKQIISNRTP